MYFNRKVFLLSLAFFCNNLSLKALKNVWYRGNCPFHLIHAKRKKIVLKLQIKAIGLANMTLCYAKHRVNNKSRSIVIFYDVKVM